MRRRLAVLVLFGLARAAAPARAEGTTVLVLHAPSSLTVEEERLVEALRIYTRDRECRLVFEGDAPTTAPSVVEVAARARGVGAAIVSWVGRRGDGRPVYYVLTDARGDLRETEVEPLGAERAALDVALKVRALLTRPAAVAAPEVVGGGTDAAPAKTEPPPAARPREPLPLEGPPSLVARPAAPAPTRAPVSERLSLGAAYGVFVPSDTAWTRQGLVLSLEVGVGHVGAVPVSVHVDGALLDRPERAVRGFGVSLGDIPFGAAMLARGQRGAWSAAVGPRLGLHVLDITADASDGRVGTVRRYAAGLGGQAQLEAQPFPYMKVVLGASLEGLVPKQDFTLAGQPAVSTGPFVAAGTAGIVGLIP